MANSQDLESELEQNDSSLQDSMEANQIIELLPDFFGIITLLEKTKPADVYAEALNYLQNYVIFLELVDGTFHYKPVENNRVLNAIFAGTQFSNSNFKPITSNFPINYALDLDEIELMEKNITKKIPEFYDFDFSKHFSLGKDFGANGLNLVPNKSSETSTSSISRSTPVKRPPNAYLIFSTQEMNKLNGDEKRINSSELAKEYGARWRAMSYLEKKPYFEEQHRLYLEHEKKYPGYKFPKRSPRRYVIDRKKVGKNKYNKWRKEMKMKSAQGSD